MKRLTFVIAGVMVAISACSTTPAERVWACATDTDAPVVRPMEECDRGDQGVRKFSAPAWDVDEDDVPIVNQELDSDFYLISSQSGHKAHKPHSGTKAQTKPKTPPAAKPAPVKAPAVKAPAPAAPRAVAPAPRVSSPSVKTGK